MPSIHPLSIPAYPGQGRRGCWSLSQHALGERQEYTLDRSPHTPSTHTYGQFRVSSWPADMSLDYGRTYKLHTEGPGIQT
uniref:Uncharacterized protein n=1 Tax=Anguilla anguilla TaxID=7936 RepID=A0A0E9S164_ANGAN